jgi:nicotinate dehydrogenase subunit B
MGAVLGLAPAQTQVGRVSFTLNGRQITAAVDDPSEPLLYVLRDQFVLTGPKFGCGLGQCGACSVLFNGASTRSCVMPISAVAGASVTTVEGLGVEHKPHPLQTAFIEAQAAQCGYCTSGMIVSAASLLRSNPHPTDDEISTALAGNLCRCGTHLRILRAVRRAAGRASVETGTTVTLGEPRPIALAQEPVNPFLAGPGSSAVDAWLSIDPAGMVTVYAGKVELGTGTDTALLQLVADELAVPFDRLRIVEGMTGLTPDQGVTSGSATIQSGSVAIRQAAATARTRLVTLAAERLKIPAAELIARDGYVVPRSGDRSRALTYAQLIGGRKFGLKIDPNIPLNATGFRAVGRSLQRIDLPAKTFGTFRYVHNLRVAGMWHARVVRPNAVGAVLVSIDRDSVAAIPNVRIVQQANFVAVAAPKEYDVIRASSALKVVWSGGGLPAVDTLYDAVRSGPTDVRVLEQTGDVDAALRAEAKRLRASYYWPFQTHGSIGPSCGVAQVNVDGTVTVWSGTQGVYPMRDAIARLIGMPLSSVRVNYAEAAGCYGHNGADDVAADAVLVARAIGKPVRVQWSRADEHGWDPKGPAMVVDLEGAVASDGAVTAWKFDGYTPTHVTRPSGMPGNLLGGQLTGAPPARNPNIGGDNDAQNTYGFANTRVTVHWRPTSVLRQSSMRGLGAVANCFANESFMDELCHAAGADPVAFRLAHLRDPRAKDVITAVAKLADWRPGQTRQVLSNGTVRGRGVAFVRFGLTGACIAMIADVDVVRADGTVAPRDVYVAHDCGLIVNPDGLRNQIEGAVIQGASRAVKEEVTFDRLRVTSIDWATYPILRFPEVPNVHIALVDRPGEPPLGAGEPATTIVAPAIANAVFAATGARLREAPFTPERVKHALAG